MVSPWSVPACRTGITRYHRKGSTDSQTSVGVRYIDEPAAFVITQRVLVLGKKTRWKQKQKKNFLRPVSRSLDWSLGCSVRVSAFHWLPKVFLFQKSKSIMDRGCSLHYDEDLVIGWLGLFDILLTNTSIVDYLLQIDPQSSLSNLKLGKTERLHPDHKIVLNCLPKIS